MRLFTVNSEGKPQGKGTMAESATGTVGAIATIQIKLLDIPEYLHNSDFYRNLTDNSDAPEIAAGAVCCDEAAIFELQTKHFKMNTAVKCMEEFEHLINTLHFWGCDILPFDLVSYCVGVNADKISIQRMLRNSLGLPSMVYLERIVAQADYRDKLTVAIEANRADLLHCLYKHAYNATARDDCQGIVILTGGNLSSSGSTGTGTTTCVTTSSPSSSSFSASTTAAVSRTVSALIVDTGEDAINDTADIIAASDEASSEQKRAPQLIHDLSKLWCDDITLHCARFGALQCLQLALSLNCPINVAHALRAAALHDHFDCLQFLVSQECSSLDSEVFLAGIHSENEDIILYLLECKSPLPDTIFLPRFGDFVECCASNGLHLPVERRNSNANLVTTFVYHGFVNSLVYVLDSKLCSWESLHHSMGDYLLISAFLGRFEMFRFLHQKGAVLVDLVCTFAAAATDTAHSNRGNEGVMEINSCIASNALNCLRYAHDNGCPWKSDVCAQASSVGNLSALIYAIDHGCIPDKRAPFLSAKHGHLSCLMTLIEHACPFVGKDCITAAVIGGHLPVLAYLHERQKCELSTSLSAAAAGVGSLVCLRYLHEHGCPWDERTHVKAVEQNQLTCLEYAHVHGCPWDASVTAAAAMSHANMPCLKYLYEHGCPWDAFTITTAAAWGQLGIIRYLHEHGCPWNVDACYQAARMGDMQCLQYLHEHGCPWDMRVTLVAYECDFPDCLEYATAHGLVVPGLC